MKKDKKFYQSKKFICFIISLASFLSVIFFAIDRGESVVALTCSITLGFISVSYIFGQAYVDKYISLIKRNELVKNKIDERR